MTRDTARTTAAAHRQGDMLITFASDVGREIEMTRANQLLLEREMAGTLDNPLDALMAQVAIEYREMSTPPARSPIEATMEIA